MARWAGLTGLLRGWLTGGLALLLAACATSPDSGEIPNTMTTQAMVYSGGPILTMEGDEPNYVEALAVVDGRIAYVGTSAEADRLYPGAARSDLNGRTMLPGFIDGHGHLYTTGFLSLTANLFAPPDGPAADHAALVSALKTWTESEQGQLFVGKYGWIVGSGYDDSQLAVQDHPDASVLDLVSRDVPVLVIHQSGHLAAINSKAMELLGLGPSTADPDGGKYRRTSDGAPNGVLEESAFFRVAFRAFANTDEEMRAASIAEGQKQYARRGYTTAQDGRSSPREIAAFSEAAAKGALYLDVAAYPDIQFGIAAMESPYFTRDRSYTGRFRIAGAKLSLDGSPQGKTAWLTAPYHVPPAGHDPDYLGYPALPDDEAYALIAKAFANDWQILIHANGDAAIDQMIAGVAAAGAKHGKADRRPVLIHGQTLRKDQIAGLVEQGIHPSLFPMHTYYWGDWHRDSVLGPERAQYISPTRDVLLAGLTLTSHHDAPVTFPNAMRVLDASVNRTTRSGAVLGADQRLAPYEGLLALTRWAAIQYFEEADKGTLSVGKLADLVILDRNPLTTDPAELHGIEVVQTIKEGEAVWTRE